jgi:Mn2+/Fe2+ NRAMP family transporter
MLLVWALCNTTSFYDVHVCAHCTADPAVTVQVALVPADSASATHTVAPQTAVQAAVVGATVLPTHRSFLHWQHIHLRLHS